MIYEKNGAKNKESKGINMAKKGRLVFSKTLESRQMQEECEVDLNDF